MCRLAPGQREIRDQDSGRIQEARSILDSLDAGDRQLVRLYYLKEYTVQQIVDATGFPEPEIYARLDFVRQKASRAIGR